MGFKLSLKSSLSGLLKNVLGGSKGLNKIIGPKGSIMQQSVYPADLLNSPNYRSGIVCTAYRLDQRTRDSLYSNRSSIIGNSLKLLGDIYKNKTNKSALANIFLPPLKTVVENHLFSYSEGTDSWVSNAQSKGIGGVIGSLIYGMVLDITAGYPQEKFGEAIDKRTKLLFNDAETRQMIYLNTFLFRNINDLIAFAEIYYLFTYLAYPQLDMGGGKAGAEIKAFVEELKTKIDEVLYPNTAKNMGLIQGLEALTDFLVIKVPPVWKIQSFTKQTSSMYSGDLKINSGNILPQSTFGPAVITSLRFNKTPNSVFNTFRAFPNDPVSVEMEITFKELFPLRALQVWDKV